MWLDRAIHFNTGVSIQKALNLRGNPHVILTTGCNDSDNGLEVVVEGDAVRTTDRAALERLAQAWTMWDGNSWHFQVSDDGFRHPGTDEPLLVLSVAPTKIFAHARGEHISQTRHQF